MNIQPSTDLRRPIRLAIDDAANGRLLPELIHLVADYIELPHRWTSMPSVDVFDQDQTIRFVGNNDDNPPTWHRMVSETTLAVGRLEWTVDFEVASKSALRSVGVGVTRKTTNNRHSRTSIYVPMAGFGNIADADDWIVFPHLGYGRILVGHNYNLFKDTRIADLPPVSKRLARYRVVVRADPTTGNVTARVRHTLNNERPSELNGFIQLAVAPDDFRLLRPCIAVANGGTATFWKSDDC